MPRVSKLKSLQPDWDDFAKAKRDLELAKAENRLLRKEMRGLLDAAEGLEDLRQEANELQHKLSASKKFLKESQEREQQAIGEVRRLNAENGQLEARIARALGRVVVIAKQDEVAALVGALDGIVMVCDATLGTDPPAGALGRSGDHPHTARLRQVRASAKYALTQAGAIERDAKELAKLQEDAKNGAAT